MSELDHDKLIKLHQLFHLQCLNPEYGGIPSTKTDREQTRRRIIEIESQKK